jgi:hypothetical protein
MNASDQPIIATLVADHDRLEFLPTLYGRYFMHVEAAVYDWMRMFARDYEGGYAGNDKKEYAREVKAQIFFVAFRQGRRSPRQACA